jgi:ribosomal-protein-alanine N-acetyltransferase
LRWKSRRRSPRNRYPLAGVKSDVPKVVNFACGINDQMKTLETERLWLRTWAPDDIELACSLWSDADVMALLGGPLSRERVQAKLDMEMACQEKHGVQYWPVFEKHTNEFVGCCGLKPWVHSPRGGHETGFHIVKAKWGRGYAFEAAQNAVSYGFQRMQLPVIRAGHHPDNVNSRKILLKLGFQYVEQVYYPPTGLMHPCYELFRSENGSAGLSLLG